MPAAAVIPAPIAYIKVVAVKKLVVEFWGLGWWSIVSVRTAEPGSFSWGSAGHPQGWAVASQGVYLEKIRVLKAGASLNILAWNN